MLPGARVSSATRAVQPSAGWRPLAAWASLGTAEAVGEAFAAKAGWARNTAACLVIDGTNHDESDECDRDQHDVRRQHLVKLPDAYSHFGMSRSLR
jgi:hypothetical protein